MGFNGSVEGQAIAEHIREKLDGKNCVVICRGNKTHYKIIIQSSLSDPSGVPIGVIGVVRVGSTLVLQHTSDDGNATTPPTVIDSKEFDLADEACMDELDKFLDTLTPEVSQERVLKACERLKKSLSKEQQTAVEAIQRVAISDKVIDNLNKIVDELKQEAEAAKKHCREKCESKVVCLCFLIIESIVLILIFLLYIFRNLF